MSSCEKKDPLTDPSSVNFNRVRSGRINFRARSADRQIFVNVFDGVANVWLSSRVAGSLVRRKTSLYRAIFHRVPWYFNKSPGQKVYVGAGRAKRRQLK